MLLRIRDRGVRGRTTTAAVAVGCGRTARELIDDSFVLHEAEHFSQLGIFRPRSLCDRDGRIVIVAENVAGASHGGVVLFVQVRPVHGQLMKRRHVVTSKMRIKPQVKIRAAVV